MAKAMGYAKRVDNTHAEVRDGLRELGYYVIDMSKVGDDFPDLLVVSKSGVIVLLEVKTPGEYPTEGQVAFLNHFTGPASLVFGLETAKEVMERYD